MNTNAMEVSTQAVRAVCLRSDSIPKSRSNDTKRLKISKDVLKDQKLFANQTVVLSRLALNLIKRYDKTFYKKYRKELKAEKSLHKYSKIRQNLIKSQKLTQTPLQPNPSTAQTSSTTNESPKRMLLWTTSPNHQNRVQTNYPILRSHSNHLKQWNKCDERESSLMSSSEYYRYLNLISRKELSRMQTKQMKTTFNIRNIGKSDDYVIDSSHHIVLNADYLMTNLIDHYKPMSDPSAENPKQNSRQKKKKLWSANKIKEKYKIIEKQKRLITEQWKRHYLKCLSLFPLMSPLGQRIYRSLNSQTLDKYKIQTIVRKYESYCSTKIRFRHTNTEERTWNKWKARNVERITTGQELSQKKRSFDCHQYSFTRRQRLERLKRLRTGIDWKSRLLALNCSQKIEISIKKLGFCPLCHQMIEDMHSCDIDSEPDASHTYTKVALNNARNVATNRKELRERTNRRSDENVPKIKARNTSNPKRRLNAKRNERICRINLDEVYKPIVIIDLDSEELK